MELKRTRVESGTEKQFLTALITSDSFLARVGSVMDPALVSSPHFRQVMQWCTDYYAAYKRAPNKDIEGLYYAWAESDSTNQSDSDAVFDLLKSLSIKHSKDQSQNVDYLVEQFKKYMLNLKVGSLKDSIALYTQRGELDEAIQQIEKFRSHSLNTSFGINPLVDKSVWDGVFAEAQTSLIKFPGAANDYLGPAFIREGLIGLQGPAKRGKTFWCLEFAMRAVMQRKRVAFFSVGDLSQNQMLRRLAVRLEGVPMWEGQCGADRPVRVPLGARTGGSVGGFAEGLAGRIAYKEKVFKYPISKEKTIEAVRRFVRGSGMAGGSNYFMLSCHPNGSINIAGIEGILNGWEYELGFIPDVIIIDYADILAPENNRRESRDQINETWSAMRRLSQRRKCLVITPTQANTKSYGIESQTMANFSNDRRKNDHVTGMLALNQTEAERRAQIMRLGWVVLRESPFNVGDQLVVGICPALGRMLCFSETSQAFRKAAVDNNEEETGK